MNKYKTSAKYGSQRLDLPDNLKTILNDYINDKDINVGDLMFGYRGKPYKNFTLLNRAFKKIFSDKNISVDLLRHSYIKDFYDSGRRSVNERKALSDLMGHSVATQSFYDRV
jgi:integrase